MNELREGQITSQSLTQEMILKAFNKANIKLTLFWKQSELH